MTYEVTDMYTLKMLLQHSNIFKYYASSYGIFILVLCLKTLFIDISISDLMSACESICMYTD